MFELDGFIPCCHLFLSVTLFHEREERLWLQNFHQSLPFILHSAVASSFISHSMFKRLIHYVLFICRFIVVGLPQMKMIICPRNFCLMTFSMKHSSRVIMKCSGSPVSNKQVPTIGSGLRLNQPRLP